MSIVGG